MTLSSVTLSWNAVPDIDYYKLTGFGQTLNIGGSDARWTWHDVSPGKDYFVKIKAIKGKLKGPESLLHLNKYGKNNNKYLVLLVNNNFLLNSVMRYQHLEITIYLNY